MLGDNSHLHDEMKLWFCGKAWKSILHQPQYTTAHSEGLNQIMIIFREKNGWKSRRRFMYRPMMSLVLLQTTNNVESDPKMMKSLSRKILYEWRNICTCACFRECVRLRPFPEDTESILPGSVVLPLMTEARLINWRHLLSGYSTLFIMRTKSSFQ
jgi:hypothetical protein